MGARILAVLGAAAVVGGGLLPWGDGSAVAVLFAAFSDGSAGLALPVRVFLALFVGFGALAGLGALGMLRSFALAVPTAVAAVLALFALLWLALKAPYALPGPPVRLGLYLFAGGTALVAGAAMWGVRVRRTLALRAVAEADAAGRPGPAPPSVAS